MRVLLCSHSSALAGAERSLLAMAELLRSQGHTVAAVLPRHGPLRRKLEAVGVPVSIMPSPWWSGSRSGFFVSVVRLTYVALVIPLWVVALARSRADVVVSNSSVVPSGACAAYIVRKRHFWIVRETLGVNPTITGALPIKLQLRLMDALSERVFAVSEYVQALIAPPLPPDKVKVFYPPLPEPSLVQRIGLTPDGSLILLYAGTFSADKGLHDAMRAVASAIRGGRSVRLIVAGSGSADEVTSARKLASSLHLTVEWCGWVEDVRALFPRVDALLMTSRHEAFGRVTAEALLAGLPILAYDAGGTSEILRAGGGLLVAPSVEALASAIGQLQPQTERQLSNAAQLAASRSRQSSKSFLCHFKEGRALRGEERLPSDM